MIVVNTNRRSSSSLAKRWTRAIVLLTALAMPVLLTAQVHHYEYVFPDGSIYVYDVDNGFSLLKIIPVPTSSGTRGSVASVATGMLYISYGSDASSGGSLLKYDLIKDQVVWTMTYSFGIDSMSISPDGKTLYMPTGEVNSGGLWEVIDANSGNVIGSIDSGGYGPHNTVLNLSGSHVYLGPRYSPYLVKADSSTLQVIQKIGPVGGSDGVRPFTINGRETMAFITLTGYLGFQVGDLITGAILYTVPISGFPNGGPASSPSHGISISPDEKEVYVVDSPNSYVHVFDITGLPGLAPVQVADIPLLGSMSGNESPCAYDCLKDGWIHHSQDGHFVYVGDSGDVIDTGLRRTVASLPPLANSRKAIEIDFQNGVPVWAMANRSSIGTVTSTNTPTVTTTSLPSAAMNTAYSATLSATGGTAPYTWSVKAGALPAGLAVAASTGVISGMPAVPGTARFAVQVSDASSATGTQSLSITVNGGLTITTNSVPVSAQNVFYSTRLSATGGTAPYNWSITTGALPAGLTLVPATGVISGTPTAAGASNFTVQVSDASSATAAQPLSITVNPGGGGGGGAIALLQSNSVEGSGVGSVSVAFPSANTTGNLTIAFVRMSTSTQTVQVTDSAGNTYVDAVSQAQTSDGHQVHIFYAKNVAGSLAGQTNTVTATFSATNNHPWLAIYEYSGLSTVSPLDKTANAQGSDSFPNSGTAAVTAMPNELVFAGLGVPNDYAGTVTAGGGYALAQQDTGLSRSANELMMAGSTGLFAGAFSISYSANWSAVLATFAAAGTTSSLAISTSALPAGTQNVSYSTTLAATGGTAPYTWSITTGALPAGLRLAATTGLISGTPTAAGTSNFTVQVSDASSATATQPLSITVNPGGGGGGAIALVQSNAVEGSGVGSVSVAFPSVNTAGNLIIAFVRMSTSTQTVQVTDSAGNTYLDAVSQAQTSDGHQVHIFYAKNVAGNLTGQINTVTATFSATNNHPWLAIYEYSGLSTVSPLDKTANAQGSDSFPNSGTTAVTAMPNELVFAGLGVPNDYAGTVTAGSGYALMQQDTGLSRSANETMAVGSTGLFAGAFSISYSTNWSAVLATFSQ